MARVNLQWKNTDACYDLYCDCNPEWPQHADGYFQQEYTCGSNIDQDDPEEAALTFCGKTWRLPNDLQPVISEKSPPDPPSQP